MEGAVHYIQRHFGLAHSNFGSEQEFDETPDLLAGQLSEERSPLFSYRQSDGVALDNWRLCFVMPGRNYGWRRIHFSREGLSRNLAVPNFSGSPGIRRDPHFKTTDSVLVRRSAGLRLAAAHRSR